MKNLVKIVIVLILILATFYGCAWLFNHSGYPFIAIIIWILFLAVLFSKKGIAFLKKLF